MIVLVTKTASSELQSIWKWNAERYDNAHADEYVRFILGEVHGLTTSHPYGRRIAGRPDLRYILIKRRSGGHGHVAVYYVGAKGVTVTHLYHTAQDWQGKLTRRP